MPKAPVPSFAKLLDDAVNQPGVLSAAYEAFHNYSVSNCLLAIFECMRRKLEVGPLNTFRGWQKLGRQVRKGEKAITLCMPVTWKQKENRYHDPGDDTPRDDEIVSLRRCFIFRPFWFVLAQTDGEPYTPLSIPSWEEERALYQLHIDRVSFVHPDGNCQGYAQGRQVAISPIAYLPHRTLLHEMAHVLLGHTAELLGLTDRDERTPKDVREVEAEAVAYLCCQSLKLPGEEFSRGYLQHWLGQKRVDERSAHKIFHVADQILKAGRPEPAEASVAENAA